MIYQKARLKDIPKMQDLVKDEVEKGIILPRSDDEIATNIRSYTIVCDDFGEIVGYCALHFHSPNLAEVRSLVVSSKLRGQGIGANLVKTILKEAAFYEISEVFTLTYRQSFFEKIGFKVIEKSKLPKQKIWADCVKCKHFPNCNEIALIISV